MLTTKSSVSYILNFKFDFRFYPCFRRVSLVRRDLIYVRATRRTEGK